MQQPTHTVRLTSRHHARLARVRDAAVRAHALLRYRWAVLTSEPESGMDDIPWKMILMIAGGVIAVGIVTAIVAFVHAQLAQLPTSPGF